MLLGVVLGVADGTAVLAVGVGVLGDEVGVLVVGVVAPGVVGVVGVVVAGVLADGEVDDGVGDVVLAEGVPGGAPVVGSEVVGLLVPAPVSGVLDVEPALVCGASGFNGFPTGSDGRVLERVVPSDRSIVGLNELPACGSWPVSECWDLNGNRNTAAASTATAAAPAPSLSTGGRLRRCRGPFWGWGCLKTNTFRPQAEMQLTDSNPSIEAHGQCLHGSVRRPAQLHRTGSTT
ncbi:hypothetical protein EV137_6856 [Kribbella pratensis]|uniref:Uncharacterized protein n=1 Tax=Kribbella pratensis TaxID=2512112 RepID=A0ABY2F712_9ACTN|nr:hypothetical protein EV137_6856 [Kribbella pratensis]